VAILGVDELQAILSAAFPGSDVPQVESVDDQSVLVSVAITDRHGRPGGTLSGPTMMTLADTAAWLAIMSQIGPVLLAVTTSLHIDFLRKPTLVDVVAEGRLLKLGKSLAVVDVGIRSVAAQELVAKAQVTYSIPPGGRPPR